MLRACWLVLALVVAAGGEVVAAGGEVVAGCGERAAHAPVVLAWHAPPAAAAAAVLRRALLEAGHEPACVRLQHWPEGGDLCTALRQPALAGAALVAVAVAHEQRWCSLRGGTLRALASGAAPLSPRLLARLAPGAPPHCGARLLAGALPPDDTLRDCLFDAREGEVALVVGGEWPAASEALGAGGLRARNVTRAELAALLATPPSRLLVDVLWDNCTLELPLRLQPELTSWLVADEDKLLNHQPALYRLLTNTSFQPEPRTLLAVLRHPAALRHPPDYDAAASAMDVPGLSAWVGNLKLQREQRVVAVLCKNDSLFERVVKGAVARYAQGQIDRLADETGWPRVDIIMTTETINCSEPAALVSLILRWSSTGETWRTAGVAAPAELAEPAVSDAKDKRLPLLAYSAGAKGVRAATCGTELLARALLRLLGACSWRRAALLTDGSVLGARLARALEDAAGPGLVLQAAEAHELAHAVAELAKQEARVFVVVGSTRVAWRVLQAGWEQGLVAARGYMWLVSGLELEGAEGALLAALAPMSVSCEARGGGAGAGEMAARLTQEVAPPWPRHLAALADALTTLALGHARTAHYYNSLEFHDQPDKLQIFWKEVQQTPVPGVVANLIYDNVSVTNAPVYVARWLNGTLARLATWREGARCPLSAPPHDGSSSCLLRDTHHFEQHCYDGALAGAIAALAAAVALSVAGRRWLRRRDARLRREATVRVLAQREAAFADLVPFLVKPTALRLGAELGAGRYGRVRRGELRAPRRRTTLVAVKALRDGASPAEESEFLREGRMLAGLRHERVVRFEGVCWDGGPPLLLMEYAFFGDLAKYLRARRHLASEAGAGEAEYVAAPALTRLAREAAEALAYLSANRLVHRDVRAANCLVDARRSLKLADFGLARHTGTVDDEYVCRGCAFFPVLWMAPESLRGVASPASDVWAFGVLVLELVTLGARPWGVAPPAAVVRAVLGGARPPLPRAACAETRALAAACWQREPARRPSAARLVRWLARRARALRPAPAADPPEPDSDSGIGEPEPPLSDVSAPR